MLVLSRKVGERVRIGDDVVVTVVRIQGERIRLGIDAPREVAVHREEVYAREDRPNRYRSTAQSFDSQCHRTRPESRTDTCRVSEPFDTLE